VILGTWDMNSFYSFAYWFEACRLSTCIPKPHPLNISGIIFIDEIYHFPRSHAALEAAVITIDNLINLCSNSFRTERLHSWGLSLIINKCNKICLRSLFFWFNDFCCIVVSLLAVGQRPSIA